MVDGPSLSEGQYPGEDGADAEDRGALLASALPNFYGGTVCIGLAMGSATMFHQTVEFLPDDSRRRISRDPGFLRQVVRSHAGERVKDMKKKWLLSACAAVLVLECATDTKPTNVKLEEGAEYILRRTQRVPLCDDDAISV